MTLNKTGTLLTALFFTFNLAKGQTTAMDFTMTDCNGNMHNLYSELDSGNVVIMEFFMLSCSPCIDAGDALEPMFNKLKSTCSNKIKFYHIGYTNSYTCTQITNWVNNNGYTSVPFDSGGVQTAYYGGMGMPTVAIAGGSSHKVLYSAVGFIPGDTAAAADSIRTFFGCSASGMNDEGVNISSISIYPNPLSEKGVISLSTKYPGTLRLELLNLHGQALSLLHEEKLGSGNHTASFSLKNISSGFYILKGELNGESFFRKISAIH